jgi:hypothetical protein
MDDQDKCFFQVMTNASDFKNKLVRFCQYAVHVIQSFKIYLLQFLIEISTNILFNNHFEGKEKENY